MSSQSSKLPIGISEAIAEMTDDNVQHIADLVDDNWRWWLLEIDPTVRAVLDHFWFRDEAQGAQALAVSDLARRRRYFIGYAALHRWITGEPWNPTTKPLDATPRPLDAATGDAGPSDGFKGKFIPVNIHDHREDPEYHVRLENLTPEDRERMLKGDFADSARVGEDAGGGSETAGPGGVFIAIRAANGVLVTGRSVRTIGGSPKSTYIVAALCDLLQSAMRGEQLVPLDVGWTVAIEPHVPSD